MMTIPISVTNRKQRAINNLSSYFVERYPAKRNAGMIMKLDDTSNELEQTIALPNSSLRGG
jgi:hypothetical protein